MNKFLKFCQKPLLLITAIVFGVFTLGLIITSVVPYAASTYTYSETAAGITIKSTVSFHGNKVTMKSYVDGEEQESTEGYFKIENGKLYVGSDENSLADSGAKVSAYKIVLEEGIGDHKITVVYKNGLTNAMRVIDIVMMVISGLGLACSITLIVLNKKGKLGKKTAKAE